MKRFLLVALIALPCYGALPSTVQWDVRTTGNDANGGGFDTAKAGTDFSQQNAAQQAYTDLVIGATTTQLTSAAHPFGATEPGNLINITGGAGCTVGRYEVNSVAVVTATMDSAVGAAGSTCTGNLGGSLATLTNAIAIYGPTNGQTINVKAGTYTQTTTAQPNSPGGNAFFTVRGYNATHGDGGTPPLITTATNSTVLVNLTHATFLSSVPSIWKNVSFSNTAAIRAIGVTDTSPGTTQTFQNCIFDGFTTAIKLGAATSAGSLGATAIEVKNSTSDGIMIGTTAAATTNPIGLSCYACYIHNNTGSGITNGTADPVKINVANSIFALNGAAGITSRNAEDQIFVVSSAFVSNTTAGILASGSTGSNGLQVIAQNSIFYANGTYGVNVSNAGNLSSLGGFNAYGANGTAPTNNFPSGIGDVTLTANPFTSSTNFALNAAAGGGALLKATGYPGVFPGATTTGALDIGPVQHACAPASTGAACAVVF